jgi:cell division transport system permease protein
MSFDIVLSDDTKDPQINQLMNHLKTSPFVKSAKYISKDDAAKELAPEIGQDPSAFLGFNPLPAMIVVNLNASYAKTDSLPVIEKYIRGFSSNVNEIQYRQELLQLANNSLTKASLVFLGLAILLLLISLVLINNTIRLTVYSKRFLIHTMKLVGATAGFIRRPFIRSFIVSGIISALIANVLLTWLLFYFVNSFTGNISGITELINIHALYFVYGCVFVAGIIFSAISVHFAVNKYVSMKNDDMFYI